MNSVHHQNSVGQWIEHRLPLMRFLRGGAIGRHPTPRNLSVLWNLGWISGFVLLIQIVTGTLIASYYTPDVDGAFGSTTRLIREVNYGWLLHAIHANGASMLFIAMYVHLFRSVYYGSYKNPREILWWLGLVILLLMMAVVFLGHILPWGQVSFWAAAVGITNVFAALPPLGEAIAAWLWNGFTVENPSLNRFYLLHVVLTFIALGFVVLHLWALRTSKPNNPLGVTLSRPKDYVPFHPYYTVKDLLALSAFILFFAYWVFFDPDTFGSYRLNYLPANSLETAPHMLPEWFFHGQPASLPDARPAIVPKWYFLPFVMILKAIPNKLLASMVMYGAILVLFALPWLDRSEIRSTRFRAIYKYLFWFIFVDVIVLGWAGSQPAQGTALLIGRIATAYYFVHFLIILPLISKFEWPKRLIESAEYPVMESDDTPEPKLDVKGLFTKKRKAL